MRILFLCLSVLIFSTCKTDPVIPVASQDCQTYTFEDSPLGPEIIMADTTYHSPCFNPNNANEIIYILKNNNTGKAELRKRKLQTKEDIYLTDAWVLNTPRWNNFGWIVFDYKHGIFKIKDNGDSLTQLIFNEEVYSPDWNIKNNKIVFFKYNGEDWGISQIDINGKNRKIIEQGKLLHPLKISPDTIMIASRAYTDADGFYLSVYNTLKQEYKSLGKISKLDGLDWFNDGEWIVWSSLFQLGKSNSITGETKILREGCYALRYSRPAVSPDGSKILVERDDIKKTGPSSGFQETNLYMMNADGSEEIKIEF